MERLRGALAFPMYGAALWLAWVFARQQGLDALGLLFVGGLAAALGLWLFGRRQAERAEGRGAIVVSILSAIAFVVAVAMTGLAMIHPAEPQSGAAGSGPLASTPWSPEAVAQAQAAGRPVFVDFTADWCVTCKINERAALASPRTAAAIAETNAVYHGRGLDPPGRPASRASWNGMGARACRCIWSMRRARQSPESCLNC